MTNTRSEDTARKRNEVLFISASHPEPGNAMLHAGVGGKVVSRTLEAVTDDWRLVVGQVETMIAATTQETPKSGYELNEVNVSLGFSADGKLAFIAQVGVEATVSLTFKRKST